MLEEYTLPEEAFFEETAQTEELPPIPDEPEQYDDAPPAFLIL